MNDNSLVTNPIIAAGIHIDKAIFGEINFSLMNRFITDIAKASGRLVNKDYLGYTFDMELSVSVIKQIIAEFRRQMGDCVPIVVVGRPSSKNYQLIQLEPMTTMDDTLFHALLETADHEFLGKGAGHEEPEVLEEPVPVDPKPVTEPDIQFECGITNRGIQLCGDNLSLLKSAMAFVRKKVCMRTSGNSTVAAVVALAEFTNGYTDSNKTASELLNPIGEHVACLDFGTNTLSFDGQVVL